MQISRSDFNILFLSKHTDLELYACYLPSLDFSSRTLAGTFDRCIISYENGKPRPYFVSVIRARDKNDPSKRTHSSRPDFLLSGSQFSIRFILFVAYQYYYGQNRRIPALLGQFGITRSTLYIWLGLFEANHAAWFAVLRAAEKIASDLISRETSIPTSLLSFLCLKGHAFLESFDPPYIASMEAPP